MKNIKDALQTEKQKVIKNLKIKKSICNYTLITSIVLCGFKSITTVDFLKNFKIQPPTTKDYVQEIGMDSIPLTGIIASCIKKRQYTKDLKRIS